MATRYIPAKLFLALALVSFAVGAALFRRELPLDMYLYPLGTLIFPRLIPLALGIISAAFGLIYLFVEKGYKRNLSISLTLVQIAFLLVGVFGHTIITRYWWRVLGDEQATNLPLPLWSVMLLLSGFSISAVAFLLNIFLVNRAPLRKA